MTGWLKTRCQLKSRNQKRKNRDGGVYNQPQMGGRLLVESSKRCPDVDVLIDVASGRTPEGVEVRGCARKNGRRCEITGEECRQGDDVTSLYYWEARVLGEEGSRIRR